MNKSVPIYIISYNRLNVLKESIQSYLKFVSLKDIIIIDNGSDYPPLKAYFKEIEQKGVKIYYNKKIKTANDLNSIYKFIEPENKLRKNNYYIVTDPDISLTDAHQDILEVYKYFLDNFLEVDIVGPMLKITDIPKDYPAREFVWKRHTEQFWHKKPSKIHLYNKDVFFQFAPIDTTFGMLRKETKYQRLLNGIRLYAPYEAYHLDWYITPSNMTSENVHFFNSVKKSSISHWGGKYFKKSPLEVLNNKERAIYIICDGKIEIHNLPKNQSNFLAIISFFIKIKRELKKIIRAFINMITKSG